jgi:hypothetical protein
MINSASIIELLATFTFLIALFPITLIIVSYCLAWRVFWFVYPLSILPAVIALLFRRVQSDATVGRMSGELKAVRHNDIGSAITAIAHGGHDR